MKIEEKTLNYVKSITAQTISNAGSGHTGTALGASSILLALFKDHYNFDVSDTDFINRDRFVLSAGHASALYYTLLSMFGFDVTLQDLKEFRMLGSRTPGHPEYGVTDGVEASTGPLGQGVANAVGMAIASAIMSERFNSVGFPIINNYTYCLAGDGDLMEGVALEACSLAGSLNLKRLVLLYDSNDVTIDGNLNLSNRENIIKKFKAMGWEVIKVKKGNDIKACSRAIAKAKRAQKPVIVIFKTTIGIGTEKEGTSATHAMALSQEEIKIFNKKMGVLESFYIPNDVRDFCMASARRGKLNHETWNQELAVYSNSNPELYKQFLQFFDRKLEFDKLLKNISKIESRSTREINHEILNEIADKMNQMVGGTADLASSTKVFIEKGGKFLAGNRRGRNLHFGVREHAMGAICNGIALYDDFVPFCSTFLTFSNYLLPAIRMSAMMKLGVIYFFTHDSILVGEDGPTHQPIEQLAQLRLIPNLNVFRPCDANELVAAYHIALTHNQPSAFILSRQNLPAVSNTSYKDALNGGYILQSSSKEAEIVIYASGSEVALAQAVAAELNNPAVSVVSMPSIEIFEKQSPAYKAKILQKNAKLRVAIEASNDNVWYKYIGEDGILINVNEYGASGKGELVYQKAGFSAKDIVKKINKALGK